VNALSDKEGAWGGEKGSPLLGNLQAKRLSSRISSGSSSKKIKDTHKKKTPLKKRKSTATVEELDLKFRPSTRRDFFGRGTKKLSVRPETGSRRCRRGRRNGAERTRSRGYCSNVEKNWRRGERKKKKMKRRILPLSAVWFQKSGKPTESL